MQVICENIEYTFGVRDHNIRSAAIGPVLDEHLISQRTQMLGNGATALKRPKTSRGVYDGDAVTTNLISDLRTIDSNISHHCSS